MYLKFTTIYNVPKITHVTHACTTPCGVRAQLKQLLVLI
jgi:hypothetical protein